MLGENVFCVTQEIFLPDCSFCAPSPAICQEEVDAWTEHVKAGVAK